MCDKEKNNSSHIFSRLPLEVGGPSAHCSCPCPRL